jgi:PAS domain S-box-containing protein
VHFEAALPCLCNQPYGWTNQVDRNADKSSLNELPQTLVQLNRAKEESAWKAAFLDAQVHSSIEGILVVDGRGRKILQNRRATDLLKMPQHIADDNDFETQVRWVRGTTRNPEQFIAKVAYLISHSNEISRDEIEFKDGRTLDCYSSPVIGKDGKHYGRAWTFRDITAHKQTENALRESNEKFTQLADHITDAFWVRSADMREVHYVSPAFERIWGRSADSLYACPEQWVEFTLPEDRERVVSAFAALSRDTPNLDIEYRIVRPSGEIRSVRARGFQVRDAEGHLIRLTGIVTDVTEWRRSAEALFQSQKLETVGKLAGGIAHEFNSILTAIIGQSELLFGDLPAGSPLAGNATEITKAAGRAATLTRQLLAYGRRAVLRPESLDLNQVTANMEGMLRHLMGDDVTVQVIPATALYAVKADAGQIEQVIMNMALNARDATPNGGKLTLETANVSFDTKSSSPCSGLEPGDYALLGITDTGTGMSDEVRARVFEPFFTTKDVGHGTGLGLSTCYGIIKQSGGDITVTSKPARGTTFKIYLRRADRPTTIPIQRIDSPQLPRGRETILLVENDPALREMAATLLRRLGYTVLVAANGSEALSLIQQRKVSTLDLLLTDVVMPDMSGSELSDRVLWLHPHTRILLMSAYTPSRVDQSASNEGMPLLQKPFTPSGLAKKLREVLDG